MSWVSTSSVHHGIGAEKNEPPGGLVLILELLPDSLRGGFFSRGFGLLGLFGLGLRPGLRRSVTIQPS